MRRIAHPDLSAAARALLAMPEARRAAEAERIILEAEAADRYRRRTGRPHPLWGNGTLEGAARGRMLADPRALSDSGYLGCLALVLEALLRHRREIHSRA